jgi:nitronate monooxygenase
MLATPWSSSLNLRTPIINAPMGGVAGGRLAAAISGAGGLGMIGVGTAGSVGLIERESAIPRQARQPFGIGLLGWAVDQELLLLDAALDAQPVLISLGFADVSPWVQRVHDAGILLATQVYDAQGARDAQTAGVDVIIARGGEGGGHGFNNVATLPLLQAVLEEVEIPVLAAGGIGSARGLAAVVAAGASGAWIGTAFLLCPEALTPAAAHSRIIRANETDTVYTRSVNAAMGFAWPEQFGERVLRNRFTERWLGEEERLVHDDRARAAFSRARDEGDFDLAEIDAGQGVGLLSSTRSAEEIVHSFTDGAAELLGRWAATSPSRPESDHGGSATA